MRHRARTLRPAGRNPRTHVTPSADSACHHGRHPRPCTHSNRFVPNTTPGFYKHPVAPHARCSARHTKRPTALGTARPRPRPAHTTIISQSLVLLKDLLIAHTTAASAGGAATPPRQLANPDVAPFQQRATSPRPFAPPLAPAHSQDVGFPLPSNGLPPSAAAAAATATAACSRLVPPQPRPTAEAATALRMPPPSLPVHPTAILLPRRSAARTAHTSRLRQDAPEPSRCCSAAIVQPLPLSPSAETEHRAASCPSPSRR